jgi:hypothetical protein
MGVGLNGAGGNERFSHMSWYKVLNLACEYGWQPAGTELPRWHDETGALIEQPSHDPDEWSGTYYTSDGQYVTDEDAAHIAEALQRALEDIPDFETGEKWVEYGPADQIKSPVARALVEAGGVVSGPNESLTPLEFFSGEPKQHVRNFIAFCRAGGFCIF